MAAHQRSGRDRPDDDTPPPTEEVRFGLDGVGYEVDLPPQDAQLLRDVVARYAAAGRRVRRRRRLPGR